MNKILRAIQTLWLKGSAGFLATGVIFPEGESPGLILAKSLELVVDGDPKPQPRPRFNSKSGTTYTPGSADRWKEQVRAAVWGATRDRGLILGAVSVRLAFRIARPKSHFGTGRNAQRLKANARKFHTQTPDVDNLAKAVLDAIGKFRGLPCVCWADDAQVVELTASKRWTEPGETPGLTMTLSRYDGG